MTDNERELLIAVAQAIIAQQPANSQWRPLLDVQHFLELVNKEHP